MTPRQRRAEERAEAKAKAAIEAAFATPTYPDPEKEYARCYYLVEAAWVHDRHYGHWAPAGSIIVVESISRQHERFVGPKTRLKIYGKGPDGTTAEGWVRGEDLAGVPLTSVRDRAEDGVGGLWWAGAGGVEERAKRVAEIMGWPFEALLVRRFCDVTVTYPHGSMR